MIVSFVVRDPIGVNAMYISRKFTSKRFKTPEARAFKDRVVWAALPALREAGWPTDLFRVKRVRLSYQLFNSRLDCDSPRKGLRDALEGLAYHNDRVCEDGPAPLSIRDNVYPGARVGVTLELLELHDEITAKRLESEFLARQVRRRKRA